MYGMEATFRASNPVARNMPVGKLGSRPNAMGLAAQTMMTPRGAAGMMGGRMPATMDAGPTGQDKGRLGDVETRFKHWLSGSPEGKKQLWRAWHEIDYNGNGRVSLAEIDKWVDESYPALNNKPALMRAYKASFSRDEYVHKSQYPILLRSILYFNKLWNIFEDIDEDTDRRVTFEEFQNGAGALGLSGYTRQQLETVFNKLDTNKGGCVLFDELCHWIATTQCPITNTVYDQALMTYFHDKQTATESPAAGARTSGGQHRLAMDRSGGRAGKAQGKGAPSAPQNREFDKLETDFKALLNNKKRMHNLWKDLDYNGNGCVSLAEIDKLVGEKFPVLDNKPALMRAYKATTRGGDAWVQKNEFRQLLRNLLYFGKCWNLFEVEDADGDRRMQLNEFMQAYPQLGIHFSTREEAEDEFNFMDENGGGMVLFQEFCKWVAEKKLPLN